MHRNTKAIAPLVIGGAVCLTSTNIVMIAIGLALLTLAKYLSVEFEKE